MNLILLVSKYVNVQYIPRRFFFRVNHNSLRQTFYVKLNNNENATLWYKKHADILDIRALYVPKKFENQGIARLLTETAFTFAIVNNYFLILSCGYVQNLYMMTKTPELQARVVGPPKVLKQS